MHASNRQKGERLQTMLAYSMLKEASMQRDEVQIQTRRDEDSDDSAKALQFDGSGNEEPDVKPDNQQPPLAQLPPIFVLSSPSAVLVAPTLAVAQMPPRKLLTDDIDKEGSAALLGDNE